MPTTKIYIQSPNYSLVLSQPKYAFNVQSPNYSIVLKQPRYALSLARGTQGPIGPPGPAGGSSVTWTAGETLSTGRVVVIDGGNAYYFQPNDVAHAGRAYGVTMSSATIGGSVNVQISGEITDAAFTFVADTILWVDVDGLVVNTQPVGQALLQRAGVASGAKKMIIDFFTIKTN